MLNSLVEYVTDLAIAGATVFGYICAFVVYLTIYGLMLSVPIVVVYHVLKFVGIV